MEFNMNNVKEMKVTDDFLTLGKDVIKCQNDESQSDCSTRKLVDNLSKHCNCLPFGMRRTEKVITSHVDSLVHRVIWLLVCWVT